MDDDREHRSPVDAALMLLNRLTEQLMCQADKLEQFARTEEQHDRQE